MNYLAHIFLSHGHPGILMGNFLGDLVRKREYEALPKAIRQGVDLHRRIDQYTDAQPQVREAVRILRPYHQKYAPVVVDVFYDYLLHAHWAEYSQQPFGEFTSEAYRIIREYKEAVPHRYQGKVQMMLQHDWLAGYGQWEGLHQTFLRLGQRARFPGEFDKATGHLQAHYEELDAGFQSFFPEILEWTRGLIDDFGF